MVRKSFEERFWEQVQKAGPDECWEWKGYGNDRGYGQIAKNGITCYAHRLSWELANNTEIGPLQILHKCDNRKCVNPNHLFRGTPQDKTSDMVQKRRQTFGEKNWKSILTEEQVKIIRSSTKSQKELAVDFGISRSAVSAIKRKKRWKHL